MVWKFLNDITIFGNALTKNKIFHGNIHPDNILVEYPQSKKPNNFHLIDFGTVIDTTNHNQILIPPIDDSCSHPNYKFYQTQRQWPVTNERIDVYSAGCVAAWMLLGKPVHNNGTMSQKHVKPSFRNKSKLFIFLSFFLKQLQTGFCFLFFHKNRNNL